MLLYFLFCYVFQTFEQSSFSPSLQQLWHDIIDFQSKKSEFYQVPPYEFFSSDLQ